MPSFTVEQLRAAMDQTEDIRSISVIAHVDHGKTTLTDSLVHRAGIISAKAAGSACYTDGRPDEKERGLTIKSTGLSLCCEVDQEDGKGPRPHLINLVDSPGHVDFSSEVTAALRITDGALVVVDCIEGCAVQTETVLRQALAERVRPCLFLNKMDRCVLELQMEPEDMYCRFRKTIEDVNVIIATYRDELMGDVCVSPEQGTAAFGSGLHGWGFSIERFASVYSKKYGVEKSTMMKRLWGDSFFNAKKKTWSSTQQPEGCDERLPRGFCQLIVEPIRQLMQAIMSGDTAKYTKMMEGLGIVLKGDDRRLVGRPLLKRTMQLWLNVADTLLTMIVTKLPSPKVAQRYRVENLYEGPMDDEAAGAIRACDPAGPLVMYVSKMVPSERGGRFYAFGRVFSGTVAAGTKARIQGPHYQVGCKDDLHIRSIQRVVVMMGRYTESVEGVPCGNTAALVGVDQFLRKLGTITTIETAHNVADMKYSVAPVVRVSVKPKEARDLPKLVEGLKRLSQADPLVLCSLEESGEHIVAGCGELHLEVCLKDLREEHAQVDVLVSEPAVSYRETVTTKSSQVCLAKAPNRRNRLFMVAEPLPEELCTLIEDGQLGPASEAKERARTLRDQFAWAENDSRKVWCWGPEQEGANIIVDQTQGIQYLLEAREHVVNAFQWTSKEGPLCSESMRGIRFNLVDAKLHSETVHRNAAQLVPTTRRCAYAAELTARPTLAEPVFLVEITCPLDALGGVYSCLNMRRGMVFEEIPREGTPLTLIRSYLPVMESFGFVGLLRQQTAGQAFPQCVFDHWEKMPGNPMEAGKLQDLVLATRKRKGLKVELPNLSDYLDKL